MNLVADISQIEWNIEMLENYLVDGTDEEKEAVRSLIRRGRSFIAYQVNQELRFAPSRFLGYINNNLSKHNKAKSERMVDGRDTNPAISKILGRELVSSEYLENEYTAYCMALGEVPDNHPHKFWKLNLTKDFASNGIMDGEFPEGKIIERLHKSRERNSKVVELAKKNFIAAYGKLFCQACGFDFNDVYGEAYIEAHHTIAVKDMKPGHKTRLDDIAMLCANCHRMVHKKRPWLSIDDLKAIIS